MECSDTERLIDAYLDRELAAEKARELESHLAECPSCRAGYAGLVDVLRPPPAVVVPEGLRDQVVAAVEEQAASLASPARGWRSPRLLRLAGAIAASLVLLGTGWLMLRSGKPALEPVVTRDAGPQPTPIVAAPSPWLVSSWAQTVGVVGAARPATCLLQAAAMESLTQHALDTTPVITVRRPLAEETVSDQAGPDLPLVPFLPVGLGNLGV